MPESEELIDQFIQEIQEEILVDGVDYDFPAGWEAGISISLTPEGESALASVLERFIESLEARGG